MESQRGMIVPHGDQMTTNTFLAMSTAVWVAIIIGAMVPLFVILIAMRNKKKAP